MASTYSIGSSSNIMDDEDSGSVAWIAGLIASIVGAAANLWSQHQANKTNKELAELQYQRSQEQINLQNEYNSEVNQMARLSAAGLNPNLVYGGASTISQQKQLPTYQAPNIKAPQFDMQSMMNMAQVISSLKTQDVQREVMKYQADKERQQANYIWTLNQLASYRSDLFALLTGQRPVHMNDEEYNALLSSPTARKYSSEYNTRVSQGEMFQAYSDLTKLNKSDREKYLSATLEARIEAEILQSQGMSEELAMKRVEREWQPKLLKRGYNLQIWNTIFRGIGSVAGLAGGIGMFMKNFGSHSREYFGPGGEMTGGFIDSFNW